MVTVLGANSVTGGYEVENSVRLFLNTSMTMTPSGAPTNADINTLSFWCKLSSISGERSPIFAAGNAAGVHFRDDDRIDFYHAGGSMRTNRVFRDTSAWYHIVFRTDTTDGTANDRLRVYINGVQETSFASRSNPDQNANAGFGSAAEHIIGCNNDPANYFNGYIAEMCFIDGLSLGPDSFGEFDSDSGIWRPIDVSGLTFGKNGFYLEFKSGGNLGDEDKGTQTADWSETNLTVIDQSTDTCTNNFATFNALSTSLQSGGVVAYTEGNTKIVTAHSNSNYLRYPQSYTTLGVTSGKWYAEFKIGAIGSASVGIANTGELGSEVTTNPFAGAADSGAVYTNGGEYRAGAFSDAGSQGTYTEDDIIGCALDLDNLAIYWHKNGTYINSGDPTSGSSKTGARAVQNPTTPGGFYVFTAGADNSGNATIEINLGSPSYSESGGETDSNGFGNFNQAVPSGYFALCTNNLAEHG